MKFVSIHSIIIALSIATTTINAFTTTPTTTTTAFTSKRCSAAASFSKDGTGWVVPNSRSRNHQSSATSTSTVVSMSNDDDNDNVSDKEENNDEDSTSDEEYAPPSASVAGAFDTLGLEPRLLSSIESQGWDDPTPIQQMAIPAMLGYTTTTGDNDSDDDGGGVEGWRSLWAEAPTGSGKTAAFALPLLQLTMEAKRKDRLDRMKNNDDDEDDLTDDDDDDNGTTINVVGRSSNRSKRKRRTNDDATTTNNSRITTLILSPTRELAMQIGGVLEELIEAIPASPSTNKRAADEEIEVLVLTGGVPLEPQIQTLTRHKNTNRNLDIVVATPGRLVDVLTHSQKVDTRDVELERRLLAALDSTVDGGGGGGGRKKDASLNLAQLDGLKINEAIARGEDGGRGSIGDMARDVRFLVVDEADRLLGRGFQKEVDELLALLPQRYASSGTSSRSDGDSYNSGGGKGQGNHEGVKTYLFSATFPEHIQPRVEKVLQRLGGNDTPPPLRLSCASSFVIDGNSNGSSSSSSRIDADDEEDGGNVEAMSGRQRKRMEKTTQPTAIVQGPDSTINLRTIRIEEKDRTQALKRLIFENTADNTYPKQRRKQQQTQPNNEDDTNPPQSWDKILVFVSTRYQSQHVAQKLRRASIPASELHGKLSMDARIRRLDDFRKGKTRVLVATDLASRGLDVKGLPVVVNYDLPRSTADFIHRVGRTGRAGQKGVAVSFVTPGGEAHFDLIESRHLSGVGVVREVLRGFEPDEGRWAVDSSLSKTKVEGVEHSGKGLAHDQMFGGVKGRRKNKKDRLREKTALEKMKGDSAGSS